ncbi:DUF952 domain-containing protein [Aeromicrobium sp.]|uniref:DUF952 domain-containing protein n=1 Tax=Aeromicrobium sp. TaxID=1871063 RepID=UPI0030C5C831
MKIFHLAIADTWHAAQQSGTYTVSTLGLDLTDVGFIHCSQAEQLDGVHERFYREVSDPVLLLLTIDTDLLTSPWQLDSVVGEPLPFPHIYGPLNVEAVVTAEPFRRSTSS